MLEANSAPVAAVCLEEVVHSCPAHNAKLAAVEKVNQDGRSDQGEAGEQCGVEELHWLAS